MGSRIRITTQDKFWKIEKIDWVSTRISLIGKSAKAINKNSTIATSYPSIARNYLEQKIATNNYDMKICHMNGSIEATIPNFFKFGIDCVESGETISCNNLMELDIIHNNLSLSLIKKTDNDINLYKINNLNLK